MASNLEAAAARMIMVDRIFEGPADLIYRIWTDPALVAEWWGVEHATNTRCMLDVRPGGRWRIDMQTASGRLYRNEGVYLEVIENERLVYTDIPDPEILEWAGEPPATRIHTVTFEDHGETTHVLVEIAFQTVADRDRMVAFGMPSGWQQSFDRLEALLASKRMQLVRLVPPAEPVTPSAFSGNAPMQDTGFSTATSADGTVIAYDAIGNGPALIITVGAFNDRGTGAALAAALSDQSTVYTYDRRGRGDSGDTQPYAVDLEVEDLGAVLQAAGGNAAVFGFSSGAALAFKAASALPIDSLILFGPPMVTDDSRPPVADDLAERVKALVDQGERGKAVELFQLEAIGMPPPVVEKMRHAPFRPGLEAMAHTLFYDLSVIADTTDIERLLRSVTMPTLVLDGGDSPGWIRNTARAIAKGLPDARHISIDGLGQDLDASLLAPLIKEFLGGR